MTLWSNRPTNTFVDVQPGGSGNAWAIFDRDGGINGPSGGGQPVESRWGRGDNGGFEPRGTVVTGNPERFTGQLSTRLKYEEFLLTLQQTNCFYNLRVRQICDDPYQLTNYKAAIVYPESFTTSRSYSDNLANATEDNEADLMDQYDFSAITESRYLKCRHDDIKKTWSDFAFNRVRNVSTIRCGGGDCGIPQQGNENYVAVTDVDNTPGYAGNPAPNLYYTTDRGVNWSSVAIPLFPNGNATDVVKAGGLILVACPTFGVAYARYQDILDQVPNPNVWTLSSGFSAPNGPNALSVVDGSLVIAVGNNGRIWQSTDGGLTFTLIDSTTTAVTLNAVSFASENLAWIGGNSGVLLRVSIANGVVATIAIVPVRTTAGVTLSSNILTVQAPSNRVNEVYVGTAGGQVWRSRAATNSRVFFETLSFVLSGNGQINDIQFAGYKGEVMFVIQTNAASNSRVLRDLSGGAMGNDVEVIGDFTSPANNKMNSIATANVNEAVTVGEVVNSYGWIGKVAA